ncbi:MAG: BREX-4 system phosphatase PglZ [Deltaproteobacteria bacterium]|jgi:hypothetical protein|nr:BREX-4 system phosphatase PglZ [Deltaproteobacteria bacterium]
MAYTLNDYCSLADSTSTRAEVYSNNEIAAKLLTFHKSRGVVEISISDCISAAAVSLPMPSTLMQELDNKIYAESKRVIVTGIEAYLSLVGEHDKKAFMTALKTRIDTGKFNVAFLISFSYFDRSKFSNPKYTNDLYIAYIGDENQYLTVPSISVVSDKWVQKSNNPTDWNSLLKVLGQFEPTGEFTLVLSGYDRIQSGLADSVIQAADVSTVAKRYYNIEENLTQAALESVVVGCKEQNTRPIEWLKTMFGVTNLNTRLAVKRMWELCNESISSAYFWMLKSVISHDSYYGIVLSSVTTTDKLLRQYVCETAIQLLSNDNARDFAVERAEAIKTFDGEATFLIIEFIDKIKSDPNETAACWLNCNTENERIEIVRRVSQSDLTVGLPSVWNGLYPLLSEYLSDGFDYGNSKINDYFRDYRRLKVKDTVTDEFVKLAYDTVLPSSFTFRDSVLRDLSADSKTAILVVDGMGAEYYPLLCEMAKRKSMNVESATIATVRLPSSTQFNHIDWDDDRILKPEIHEVDNISHNGAVKYQNCTPAHNIVATLAVFETITNRVAEAFSSFERVVVTADHGSSRLAVIAHEKNMDMTLPWKDTPNDWRYSVAPNDMERPPEFERYYDAKKNITYWIVRGYNRLPKQGGKLSVHGGATLEERLVPVVVFTKAKSTNASKHIDNQKTEQLVDKIGFDI